MTRYYVAVYLKEILQARHLIPAMDRSDVKPLLLKIYPQYRNMKIVIEGVWK